jgi:Flp pilus assembly protein TadD
MAEILAPRRSVPMLVPGDTVSGYDHARQTPFITEDVTGGQHSWLAHVQHGSKQKPRIAIHMATNVDAFVEAVHYQAAGKCSLAAGNFWEAVANYEQALRLRPDFGEAYNDLGIAWQRLGESARAEGCYRQAIRIMPSLAPAFNNLGTVLRGQGKWDEAFVVFEQAVRLEPDNPELALILGVNLYERGMLDRAVGYFRQALRLNPGDAALSTDLAIVLTEQGLLDDAVAQHRETLKIDPDHAMAYDLLSGLAAEGRYQFTPDVPPGRFTLNYDKPGSHISDARIPGAENSKRGRIDYVTPADREEAIRAAQERSGYVPPRRPLSLWIVVGNIALAAVAGAVVLVCRSRWRPKSR